MDLKVTVDWEGILGVAYDDNIYIAILLLVGGSLLLIAYAHLAYINHIKCKIDPQASAVLFIIDCFIICGTLYLIPLSGVILMIYILIMVVITT